MTISHSGTPERTIHRWPKPTLKPGQGPACRGPPEARGLPSFHYAPPGALQGTSKDAATHLGSKLPPPPPATFLCLEAHEVSEAVAALTRAK